MKILPLSFFEKAPAVQPMVERAFGEWAQRSGLVAESIGMDGQTLIFTDGDLKAVEVKTIAENTYKFGQCEDVDVDYAEMHKLMEEKSALLVEAIASGRKDLAENLMTEINGIEMKAEGLIRVIRRGKVKKVGSMQMKRRKKGFASKKGGKRVRLTVKQRVARKISGKKNSKKAITKLHAGKARRMRKRLHLSHTNPLELMRLHFFLEMTGERECLLPNIGKKLEDRIIARNKDVVILEDKQGQLHDPLLVAYNAMLMKENTLEQELPDALLQYSQGGSLQKVFAIESLALVSEEELRDACMEILTESGMDAKKIDLAISAIVRESRKHENSLKATLEGITKVIPGLAKLTMEQIAADPIKAIVSEAVSDARQLRFMADVVEDILSELKGDEEETKDLLEKFTEAKGKLDAAIKSGEIGDEDFNAIRELIDSIVSVDEEEGGGDGSDDEDDTEDLSDLVDDSTEGEEESEEVDELINDLDAYYGSNKKSESNLNEWTERYGNDTETANTVIDYLNEHDKWIDQEEMEGVFIEAYNEKHPEMVKVGKSEVTAGWALRKLDPEEFKDEMQAWLETSDYVDLDESYAKKSDVEEAEKALGIESELSEQKTEEEKEVKTESTETNVVVKEDKAADQKELFKQAVQFAAETMGKSATVSWGEEKVISPGRSRTYATIQSETDSGIVKLLLIQEGGKLTVKYSRVPDRGDSNSKSFELSAYKVAINHMLGMTDALEQTTTADIPQTPVQSIMGDKNYKNDPLKKNQKG